MSCSSKSADAATARKEKYPNPRENQQCTPMDVEGLTGDDGPQHKKKKKKNDDADKFQDDEPHRHHTDMDVEGPGRDEEEEKEDEKKKKEKKKKKKQKKKNRKSVGDRRRGKAVARDKRDGSAANSTRA